MTKITESVKTGRILVSDGAWGTFLYEKGLAVGECPESWCLTHVNDLHDIANAYVTAEADIISTNSFGANRFKLAHYGLAADMIYINETAAKISRLAAGDKCWVAASVGPTGKLLVMGDTTEVELYEAFKAQVTALEAGGANAVCIETMSDTAEASLAIRAAKKNTALEVMCTFTFEQTQNSGYRTFMGITPSGAARSAIEACADIIGANCGDGFEGMIDIVKEMRAVNKGIPILIQSNAGLPISTDTGNIYPDTPGDMARFVPALIAAGANIIGGCCGAGPEHIKAIVSAVRRTSIDV